MANVGLLADDRTLREPMNWMTTFVMVLFHVGAIAALFLFTWKGLAFAALLWWVTGSLGVGMGYHRLLTHRGYKCPRALEYFLTTCGALAMEGGPMYWVAIHRMHHRNSDEEGDPHSPRDGGFWAHIGWVITGRTLHNDRGLNLPCVPDLRKNKFHMWISKWYWILIVALSAIILAMGGVRYLMWGIFFRTVVGLHATFLVNSATHMWGRRRFPTCDRSRNSFWIALLTWGEGWHNNHHAYPQAARHGLAWYEFDMNWYGIWALSRLGLAWDIKLPKLRAGMKLEPNAYLEQPAA
jgi:stearoyl-CoA desaturase (delta-9 desaturase)